MRAHALVILNERVASPNEIATELEESLPTVSYHVRMLFELGCVELVRTAPRRGAIEHYYRAVARPFFSDRDWRRLPRSVRQENADATLELILRDLDDAIRAGSFEARHDRHLSRTALVLDEQGWTELNALLEETLDRAGRIAAASADRLGETDGEALSTTLAVGHFEAPATR
ncbi:MAG: hypothetical protein ACRDL4_05760 [Thermoleophilaceae bacterium]